MANHSGIIDSGTHFEIVPNTRKITVPLLYKVIGTVGDHLSEQLTFRCPKLIDGHDVAGCARHYITWKNVNQEVGHDELNIVDSDDEYIYFTWLVRGCLAVAKGLVSFSVHFEDTDANDLTVYRWSTATCTECEILDSINAVLGTYEAIYVAGDTLVIADYTPVKDGVLTLETNGLIPEGTMQIEANGTYDVGEYAQVDVAVSAETPEITIDENGLITAEANGVKSELQLDAPEITVSNGGKVTAEANGVTSEFELDAPTVTVTNSGYAKATSHGKETTLFLGKPLINIYDNGTVKAISNNLAESVKLSAEHDPHFIPANIKKDVNIFGVTGSYDPVPLVQGTIYTNSRYSAYQLGCKVAFLGVWHGTSTTNTQYCSVTLGANESFTAEFAKDTPIVLMPVNDSGVQQLFAYCDPDQTNSKLIFSADDGSLFAVRPTDDNFSIHIREESIAAG